MKNLLLLILLLTLINSCGTDQGEGKSYVFTIVNSSGHEIRIDSYLFPEEEAEIITLPNGESITRQFNSPPPPLQEYYSFISFFKGDSIIITYDNAKKQIYVEETNCDGSARNPLNLCLYGGQEETFTFTKEDYENAILCDGNCN